MAEKKGVKIYLVPRTRIPIWIRIQDLNVSVETRKIGRGRIRILTIKGGKADFYPGGGVGVIMPRCTSFKTAFGPLKVLKITDLKQRLIVDNHYLCEKCFANTGVMIGYIESDIIARIDAKFQCSVCDHKWEHKRI